MADHECARIHRGIADLYERGWLAIGETDIRAAHAEGREGDFFWASDAVTLRRSPAELAKLRRTCELTIRIKAMAWELP